MPLELEITGVAFDCPKNVRDVPGTDVRAPSRPADGDGRQKNGRQWERDGATRPSPGESSGPDGRVPAVTPVDGRRRVHNFNNFKRLVPSLCKVKHINKTVLWELVY